ncbi:MAG: insulinase family protein [Alphaproteobacteria bacterium]|jgi:zinc protease|nr:insulinase family protein [Alphaproteobacteria bacterium]
MLLAGSAFSADYDSFTLNNGLKVHVIKTNSPIITHAIAYNVGSIEERSGREGIAHFLEHAMFLGTNKYSKADLSNMVKETGAYYNAFTSFDITLYYFNLPARHLSRVMEFEADRMKWLQLNESLVENEKQVILQEAKMYQNNVYSVFYDTLRSYTYPTTNYGRSLIGYEDYFKKLTLHDIQDFYDTWYTPSNAQVFIIGNVDFTEVRKLANNYYGKIPKENHQFIRAKTTEEPYKADVRVVFKDKRVNQKVITRSYLVPSLVSDTSENKKDAYSLILLEDLLSSKFGEIYKYLVLDKKLLVDFSVNYGESQKGSTTFSFSLIPNKGVDDAQAIAAFEEILNKTLAKGFTQQNLRMSVNRIKDSLELMREDDMQYLFMIARYLNAGLSYEETQKVVNTLDNITSADVHNTYNKYLKNVNYILGVAQGE